ncbi:hypothetical protein QJS66_16115 [Kocuria rhizophila]|nr:hypothetical protein QJS66_16115 [Kocuria rhizophila]
MVVGGGNSGRLAQATVPLDGSPAEMAWVISALAGPGLRRSGSRPPDRRTPAEGSRVLAHIHPEHEASQRIARRVDGPDTVVDGEVRWAGNLS